MDASWFAPLAAVVVVGLAVVVVGVVLLRPRRAVGISLLAAGVAILALVAAGTVAAVESWGRQPLLWSNDLSETGHGFSAEIEHERIWASGFECVFRVDESRDELYDELSAAYPGGSVRGDTWSVVAGGLGYTVTPALGYEDGDYMLLADVLTVRTAVPFFVPFPREALTELGGLIEPWEPTASSLDSAAFAAYYDALGTVRADGDTFVVPTSDGRTATVTVADGTVTVTPEPS